MNRNPWQARLARHAKRRPVPIEDVQAQAYGVLQIAYEGVAWEDPEQRRKAVLAYFQGLTTFARLRALIEIEGRCSGWNRPPRRTATGSTEA